MGFNSAFKGLNYLTTTITTTTTTTTTTTVTHSFSSLPYDSSKASSKASSPHNAIQSFLFQMRVTSPFLKVIQLASYVFFLVFLSLLSAVVSFLQ
jgi:hypothetical protein